MTRARTIAACHADATRALLAAIFHEGPVFRMGFDSHVRAWKRHVARAGVRRFNTDPAFRAAYRAQGGTFGRWIDAADRIQGEAA